jgi:predicted nucleic acid-binding protein
MATKRWVVNTSPLILLGKTDHLDLLAALADTVIIPQSVVDEISAKLDGTAILGDLAQYSQYDIVPNDTVTPDLLAWDLGSGESRVIANALQHGANRVVFDDRAARRCAQVMGLKVIGTLGIVARAKRLDYIVSAAPILNHLRNTGLYVSDELVQRILQEIDE